MLYRRLYFGDCPDYVRTEAERRTYDLYLLTSPDTPFVHDPQRHHPDQRGWFFDRSVEWLEQRSARYTVIAGTWETRFEHACAAIDALINRRG
jgi:nicotinamide riboside kinase